VPQHNSAPAALDGAQTARPFLLLGLAGLLIRLVFVALEPATPLVGDERTWINWGIALPEGIASSSVSFSPFRTSMIFHPPLFPYFIAGLYRVFGTLTAVKLAQAAVGAIAIPAVGLLGQSVFGPRVGVGAAGLAAFYPELIWYSAHFWSEPLFMALLWWAFAALLVSDSRASPSAAVLSGVLWGLACLARETALYFVPVAALWLAFRTSGGKRRAAAFLLATLVVVLPWTVRNAILYRACVPISTMGGLNLWQGNSSLPRAQVYERYEAIQGRIEQYRYARRMGVEAILARQPLWLFEKVFQQAPHFFEVDSLSLIHIQRKAYGAVPRGVAFAASAIVILPYVCVMVLSVLGLAGAPLHRRSGLLFGFLAYYLALHVVTYGYSRFRVPLLPAFFALAAEGALRWREGRRLHPGRKALVSVLLVGLGAALLPSLKRNAEYLVSGHVVFDEPDPAGPR